MYLDEISNTSDLIDSREIDERIDYLKGVFDDDLEEFDDDELQELINLKELKNDLEDYAPDWKYGATLINESYFEEYTKDLIKDCYNFELPDFVYVDWERTARDVKMDYTSAVFDGETFWVR